MTEVVVAQRNTVSSAGFSNPLNLPANAEANSHVKVYADDTLLTLGVDYTLAGVGDTGDLDEIDGVNVLLEDHVIEGEYDTFTVVHEPPLDQDSDLGSGGTLGSIFELALDALARRLQSVGSLLSRALSLPPGLTGVSVTLPRPEGRRALIWNEAGTALINSLADPDTSGLVEAAAYAEAAEAAAAATAADRLAVAADKTAAAQSAAAAAQSAIDAAAAAGDVEAVLEALDAAQVPVGTSIMFNSASPPATGRYLKENGAAVSRTTYAELFSVIGTTFGAGDGSTTFNLPESRGEFFRGLDDGRGIDSGRTIGSAQSEMVGPHGHTASTASAGGHTHTVTMTANARYGLNPSGVVETDFGSSDSIKGSGSRNMSVSTAGAHTHTVTVNDNTGTENRPRNKAKLMCIKY